MATKAQKVKVGVFLAIGLALFIAIFIIVQERKREPTDTFFIKFQESVSGLGKDSKVLYKGVAVGRVVDVRVTEKNDIIVKIGIEKNRVKLKNGTSATLDIANLMGGMIIELSGGDPAAPALAPGSYIPSKPSILENIAKEIPKILEEIKDILSKINLSVGDVKEAGLSRLVRDVDEVVKSADRALVEMTDFLHDKKGDLFETEYELTRTVEELRKAIIQAERAFSRLSEDPSSVFWGRPKPEHPYVK